MVIFFVNLFTYFYLWFIESEQIRAGVVLEFICIFLNVFNKDNTTQNSSDQAQKIIKNVPEGWDKYLYTLCNI